MAGSEFGWGTYKTVFTQRPSRLVTWVAKIVVLGVLMLILTLLFFLVAAASAAFFGAIDGVQSSWPSLTDFAKAAGAAWLIFAMWASMGLFLAVIFKQSALAVGLGLVYLLIIEGIISAVVGSSKSLNFIIKPLPGPNANALVQSFGQARFGRPANPEPLVSAGQASIVLAVYCVVFLVVAGFLLQRRDVT
jgi:ABC-type transport system involved in multi-copper enzyme maturation permease subunit